MARARTGALPYVGSALRLGRFITGAGTPRQRNLRIALVGVVVLLIIGGAILKVTYLGHGGASTAAVGDCLTGSYSESGGEGVSSHSQFVGGVVDCDSSHAYFRVIGRVRTDGDATEVCRRRYPNTLTSVDTDKHRHSGWQDHALCLARAH